MTFSQQWYNFWMLLAGLCWWHILRHDHYSHTMSYILMGQWSPLWQSSSTVDSVLPTIHVSCAFENWFCVTHKIFSSWLATKSYIGVGKMYTRILQSWSHIPRCYNVLGTHVTDRDVTTIDTRGLELSLVTTMALPKMNYSQHYKYLADRNYHANTKQIYLITPVTFTDLL
jgi:hypothetical protein